MIAAIFVALFSYFGVFTVERKVMFPMMGITLSFLLVPMLILIIHDVGKIAVPDYILLKPDKLTDEEFEKIKLHAQKGGEMIKGIFSNFADEELLEQAYNIAIAHHEKWNGKGYPKGLCGEDIPLEARLMAIADVFDALVSDRVYKKAIPPEEAFNIIISGAGNHFDPDIIEILVSIKDDFIAAAKEAV